MVLYCVNIAKLKLFSKGTFLVWFLVRFGPKRNLCEICSKEATQSLYSECWHGVPGTTAACVPVTNLLAHIVDTGQQPSLRLLWLLSDLFLFSFTEPLAGYMVSFIAKGTIFLYRSLALSRFSSMRKRHGLYFPWFKIRVFPHLTILQTYSYPSPLQHSYPNMAECDF